MVSLDLAKAYNTAWTPEILSQLVTWNVTGNMIILTFFFKRHEQCVQIAKKRAEYRVYYLLLLPCWHVSKLEISRLSAKQPSPLASSNERRADLFRKRVRSEYPDTETRYTNGLKASGLNSREVGFGNYFTFSRKHMTSLNTVILVPDHILAETV